MESLQNASTPSIETIKRRSAHTIMKYISCSVGTDEQFRSTVFSDMSKEIHILHDDCYLFRDTLRDPHLSVRDNETHLR